MESRSEVVVDRPRRGRQLEIVTKTGSEGQFLRELPSVLGEAVVHLHPEVVLALRSGSRVECIDGLNKAAVVEAGVGIGVPQLPLECVLNPILEVGGRGRFAVAVEAAALIEVDHYLMHKVHVSAELEAVSALRLGEDIGELKAMLIRFSDARQRVGHTEGDHSGCHAGAGGIGAGCLQVAAPLGVNLVDRAVREYGGQCRHQETLMVAGWPVRGWRTVGEGWRSGCIRWCCQSSPS